jgi:4-amino-4-deoxy-L-arabinose transferase-like glycosyltransferase
VGVLITLLVALSACGLGGLLFGRWTRSQDPAARWGLHGILGLGAIGWITLPVGLLPGGFRWGLGVVALLALVGLYGLIKDRPRSSLPKGPQAIGLLTLVLAGLVALVSVLAPSDLYDWDSLAYHLALAKVWLAQGQMTFVSYDHHSNFPYLVDGLSVWGQAWGGQGGAKAFMLAFAVYGCFSVFGLARARYGAVAAWWSTVAFATVPVVVWESGTAYIDVAHSLFGGLGIWLAAGLVEVETSPPGPPSKTNHLERGSWILPALLLGGAVGSKYTALQTVPILGAVLLVYAFVRKAGRPMEIVKMGVVALAIGAPWYVKNLVNTGNPVYPFFYSVLHGRNWDAFAARIYSNEQQTFGAGRPMSDTYTEGPIEPVRLGSSILGTAYMPGRYTNPGQTQGLGFPFSSLGAIPLAALFVWLISGRTGRREGVCLAVALVSFGVWFVLSQQSRYAFVWCLPLILMAGGAVTRLRAGPLFAGAIALQALGTLYVQTRYDDRFAAKLRIVLGTEKAEDYETRMVPFAEPARFLNNVAKGGRVALYNELFGYFLDVPYVWADPGNSTELDYAAMKSGDDLVAALRKLGVTHVYIALGVTFGGNAEEAGKWLGAAGLNGSVVPYSPEDRAARMVDPQNANKVLLAEAIGSGKLHLIQAFGNRPERQRLVFVLN